MLKHAVSLTNYAFKEGNDENETLNNVNCSWGEDAINAYLGFRKTKTTTSEKV